jgi:hypothetical protein
VPGRCRTRCGTGRPPQRLHRAVTGLGDGGGVTGQHRTRRRFGVDGVGLGASATVVPVRLVDLDDVEAALAQMPMLCRSRVR